MKRRARKQLRGSKSMENCVIFKAEKKIFRLLLDESASMDDIFSETEKKLHKSKDFFKGETITLGYSGKELTDQDKAKMKELFESIGEITVKEIIPYQGQETIKREFPSFSSSGERSWSFGAELGNNRQSRRSSGMKVNKNDFTKFVKGTVRSGVLIEYDGNVLVLGDVNPGAEIKAKGNIVVMGTIKGLVHAGTDGDRSAYIVANRLKPTQLRIADLITRPPDDSDGSYRPSEPEVANIEGNSIFIDPLSVFLNKK
jgi:septum site-determining protein MinC